MGDDSPSRALTWIGRGTVVGAIVLLAAIIIPAVNKAREAAQRNQSRNNLKHLGLALHNYHDAFNAFPPGGIFDADGKAYHSWTIAVVPYIDQNPYYNTLNFQIPWDHPRQLELYQPGIPIYRIPGLKERMTADGLAETHYAASDLVFYRNSSIAIKHLTNGTSQTIALGEANGNYEPFGYPYNWRDVGLGLKESADGFGCPLNDESYLLMCDGSVRSIHAETDAQAFASLKGVNARFTAAPPDVTKPDERYKLSPPVVCLWVDQSTGVALSGVQDESGELIRAWFCFASRYFEEPTARPVDKPVEWLKSHPKLKDLNARNGLSDAGLRTLKELPALESLQIDCAQVTNRGISAVAECPRLMSLTLNCPSVNERGYEQLAHCPQLRVLDMKQPRLSDAAWLELSHCPKLELIDVSYDYHDAIPFSAKAVSTFRRQRPECEIRLYRGDRVPLETIEQIAQTGAPWPKYQYRGK